MVSQQFSLSNLVDNSQRKAIIKTISIIFISIHKPSKTLLHPPLLDPDPTPLAPILLAPSLRTDPLTPPPSTIL
jgi:hypothetical protein